MNKSCLLLALWAVLPAAAQTPADEAAERARIATERSRIEGDFERDQRACYGKFAVNDCLAEARSRRRDALAPLRAQEITLEDAERKRRAAERMKDLDERRDAQARQREEDRARAQQDERDRQQRAAAKAGDAQRNREQAQGRAERAAQPRDARTEPDTQQNAQRHRERVTEAQERKARMLERAAREGKPAKPLPVPP
ncbi:hypothetical protein PE066_20820 [Ramlibacter tataouinensis]|uniref:hypothetical protein n=1 Tax=Ramlibacter tataouinensis TaxID=94132 RepID=UPI0022F3B8FF|nr:hypothetical protein [Ramlibacter tataouinensis]WBY01858.1 hypothetical protein PE066_20820 [Ramlibacter tataouinensis]